MIEVTEALDRILSKCQLIGVESRSVERAVGFSLAEDVNADVDSPPHDKSLVDGFAIRMEDVGKDLHLIEQVVAGRTPTQPIRPGATSHIMTGAPIPRETEAMVMVEDAIQLGDAIRIPAQVERGQFIMRRAATFARGDVVKRQNARIRPLDVGLLCEVGRHEVLCVQKPRVAVLPTGDELVPCTQVPGVGQIRNTNGPMLSARIRDMGCEPIAMEVGRDDEQELRRQVGKGLEADVLVLSGGVSAGVRDLVPATLSSLNVVEVFHKVRLKPGKPLWFGFREEQGHRTLVFGLPGNPVSSLVCFELFVLPAIRAISGLAHQVEMTNVRLSESFTHRGNRPTYYPAKTIHQDAHVRTVRPLPWRGSSDLLTISQADFLIHFQPGDRTYSAGAELQAYFLG